jgi:hypothetical protein
MGISVAADSNEKAVYWITVALNTAENPYGVNLFASVILPFAELSYQDPQ